MADVYRVLDRVSNREVAVRVLRGSFGSVRDLIDAIRAFIDGWNERCHPFAWTKTADQILAHATSGQRTSFTATSGSGNHPPVSRGHTPTSHQLVPPEVPSSRQSAAG